MAPFLRDYLVLCKPRVVLLMLLTTWAGMYLATTQSLPWSLWIYATVGIALMSGSAATLNHIIDHRVDALMERTKNRPLVTGKLSLRSAWIFATMQGVIGFLILYFGVNPLTAILTFLAAVGYAGVYSLYLKRATSQNIVIGGLAGAMPPLLGWTSVTGQLDPEGWLLVLIIFSWTPAHFWALCLHRYNEYKQTSIPMLPITHGISFTKLNIVLYSLLTIACSLLPFAIGMSGQFYLICVLLLDAGLLIYALKLQFATQDNLIALKTFQYSLIYLTGLFLVILLDHHLLIN
ncbi:heme o synthase [Aquicella lusitana]|uniref:Protoheme IX farnesyltransferase n=1 Tax=Aquicella lusitana TaxID=254246 RepID=A0A370GF18_9COXI|nr:heme o synthase [Aquicella lusitana]RDI42415.1 protoheme IX farnesyltransferase [Aquicella lusitana]VVC74123.1 Protoheme IX farnesyltransferase [Aquicella lusitana]